MHVVVLGAGVIGVTTAYYLTERGHTVTVIERADEVASGASGGNGCQLSYSFTDAMASPALLSKLPRVLAGLEPALRFRPPMNALPANWGLSFLRQCSSQNAHSNTIAVLQMATRSSKLMAELQSRVPLEFSFRKAGKLVILGDKAELEAAENTCVIKRQHGCDIEVVTLERAREIEPALASINTQAAGAVYSENDEVGDALRFTSQLGQWLSSNTDTDFQFNTTVRNIAIEKGKIGAIETDKGTLKADAVVVCLGAWSSHILKPLGIKAMVYPVRGYSVTLPTGGNSNSVSITDLANKVVYSRLGDQIRIAGFADFAGFRTNQDEKRVQMLLDTARKFAPDIANYDVNTTSAWGGFRPMTPNSRPLVGPTSVEGLYLNTGHGMLGWTLACATGHEVAALLKK
jgi:D-amino-acid dehydrogenase